MRKAAIGLTSGTPSPPSPPPMRLFPSFSQRDMRRIFDALSRCEHRPVSCQVAYGFPSGTYFPKAKQRSR